MKKLACVLAALATIAVAAPTVATLGTAVLVEIGVFILLGMI